MSASECMGRIDEIRVRMDTISPKSLATASKTPAPSSVTAAEFADELKKAVGVDPTTKTDGTKPTELVDAINKLTDAITGNKSALTPGSAGSGVGTVQQSLIDSLIGAGARGGSQQSQIASLLGVTL